MKRLEVRRHSLTQKGAGSALSQAGIELARRIGSTLGPFDRVLATEVARTVETAVAMGFAVHDTVDAGLDRAFWDEAGRHQEWSSPDLASFYREALASGGEIARVGRAQRDAWLAALGEVPDGRAVLAISHGHAIESGLLTSAPESDFVLTSLFEPCEGFRCTIDHDLFVDIEILRA